VSEYNDDIGEGNRQVLGSGQRLDQDFSREEFRFKAKNISSEFAPKVINLINVSDLSTSCKIHLIDVVNVSFDPNAMLARNDSIIARKLTLEIALNLSVAAMDESDVQNPALLNISQAIVDAFGDFVSPSIGGKERDRVGKSEFVQTNTQHYTGLNQPQPERRGLNPFNRGGGGQ
jgi:hypothetical protein